MTVLTLLFYTMTNGASVASNFWLADWSTAEGNINTNNMTNDTSFKRVTACDKPSGPDMYVSELVVSTPLSLSPSLSLSSLFITYMCNVFIVISPFLSLSLSLSSGCYLGVYAGLGFTQAIIIFLGAFSLALAAIFASRMLHSKMLKNILRSPMSFFDTTPLGRVLNRFSKDIYIIDEVIPRSLRSFLFTFFTVINSLVVIVVTTPIFIVAIVPLGIFYFLVQVKS